MNAIQLRSNQQKFVFEQQIIGQLCTARISTSDCHKLVCDYFKAIDNLLFKNILKRGHSGTDLEVSPKMKPSSYSLLKFVYLTGRRQHSLEVHPS